MSSLPRVSVIIPSYKSARFISTTLDSVLAQTMPDFEVLVVDDCSPDETVAILKRYAKDDKRITVIEHKQNQGAPAYGRNTGLAVAKGEYVAFMDHDDLWEPTKLEKQVAYGEKEKLDFVCSNIFLLNDDTGVIDGRAWGGLSGNVRKGFAQRLLQGNFVPPASTLIRRSVFAEVGVFDTSLKGADDFDMWYRIVRKHDAGVMMESLATWRYRNAGSISANDVFMIQDELAFYRKIAEGEGDWSQWERQTAREGMRRNMIRLGHRKLVTNEYDAARTLYAQAGARKLLLLARTAPGVLRFVYQLKRRRPTDFRPLDLDFS